MLCPLPAGRRSVGRKFKVKVFKVKRNADGGTDKYKARYLAKGFTQIEGIDFQETFAPTAKPESVRLVLAQAAQDDAVLWHMDVKSAYLQSGVEEDIYVQQPPGYEQSGSRRGNAVLSLKEESVWFKTGGA